MTSKQRIALSAQLRIALILAALALGTGAVYYQVLGFEFVNADDQTYVTNNLRVQRGLSGANGLRRSGPRATFPF